MKLLGICGLGLIFFLTTGACNTDKSNKSQSAQATANRNKEVADGLVAPSVFKRIPADTVFVFANYEPWDQSLVDVMRGGLGESVAKSVANWSEEHPWMASLLEENPDLLTMAGLEKIGVSVRPLFAVYTHDLSVVVRIQLTDGKAMRAFLEKTMATYANPSVEPQTLNSMQYWESPPGSSTKLLGVDDKELVLALMPSSVKAELLPYILGDKRPAKNIIDTGELKKVVAKHGGAKGVGYLSLTALVDLLLSSSSAVVGTPFDLSQYSAICQSEFKELAGLAPKLTFGIDSMNTDKVSMFVGVDLRSDLAKGVAAAVEPVPGYSYAMDSDAMMAFGQGFNTEKTLSLLEDAAKKLKSSPYQCELLTSLNDDFSEADDGLDQLPPVLNDVVGYIALFDTFDRESPKSSTGMLAIESVDLNALLAFASIVFPQASKLELEIGGKPVKLELGELTEGIDAYAGRSETMLGIAAGDSKSKLNSLLSSKTPPNGPFFFAKFNFASSFFTDEADATEKGLQARKMLEKLGTWSMTFEADDSGLKSQMSITFR